MTFLQMCKYYERTDLYLTIINFLTHVKTSQWYKDNVLKNARSFFYFNSVDINLICTGKYGTTPVLFKFTLFPANDSINVWDSQLYVYRGYTTELNNYLKLKKGFIGRQKLCDVVDLHDLMISAEDNQWLADVFKTLEIVAIDRSDLLREYATAANYNIVYLLYNQLGDPEALKHCGVQTEAGTADNEIMFNIESIPVDSVTDAPDVTLNGKTYQAELIKFNNNNQR